VYDGRVPAVSTAVRRFGVAAVFTVALWGSISCESTTSIGGIVTIPMDVQNRFSDQNRGRLRVLAGGPGLTLGQTAYILCAPGASAIEARYSLAGIGCAADVLVTAQVLAVGGIPRLAALPCGMADAVPIGGANEQVIASAEQVVFAGADGCPSGSTKADLVVSLIPAQP
jgi:hypothetical protein